MAKAAMHAVKHSARTPVRHHFMRCENVKQTDPSKGNKGEQKNCPSFLQSRHPLFRGGLAYGLYCRGERRK